jgi:hypothetical protein
MCLEPLHCACRGHSNQAVSGTPCDHAAATQSHLSGCSASRQVGKCCLKFDSPVFNLPETMGCYLMFDSHGFYSPKPEPRAIEHKDALGYVPGRTAAEGLSDRDVRALLGQCIDANALVEICNNRVVNRLGASLTFGMRFSPCILAQNASPTHPASPLPPEYVAAP